MEERKYCVYMHKNIVNNKVYIGITCRTPNQRWSKGKGYKGQYFERAINKYGWDNFEHTILENNLNKDEAYNKEIELIKLYKATNREYGYNVDMGGFIGIEMTEEQTIKMRNRVLGSKNPMAKKVICNNITFDCLKDCAEYYNTSSDNMGSWINGKMGCPKKFVTMDLHYLGCESLTREKTRYGGSKQVYCDGEIYKSAKICAERYNINSTTMTKWLNKRNNIPQEFIDKELHYVGEEKNKTLQIGTCKKVICDSIIFETIADCAEFYNINNSTFSSWINGYGKMPKKFYDLGLRQLDSDIEIKTQEGIKLGSKNHNAVPIYCFELDKTFGSIVDCVNYFKEELNIIIHAPNITAQIKGRQTHTKGYTFKYKKT